MAVVVVLKTMASIARYSFGSRNDLDQPVANHFTA
jgi:hypothetical protein